MRYLKMFGLAVVAPMVVMALAGASSASATVLCTTTTTPCNSVYLGALSASLEFESVVTLETTSGSIEDSCLASGIEGPVTNVGGASATVALSITALNLTLCSQTTAVTEGHVALEIHSISGTDNGTVTASGSKVTVNSLGVSCVFGFGAGTDLGTFTGGNPATLDIHAVVQRVEGGVFCPLDWIFNAHYVVTAPGLSATLHVEPS